MTRKAKAGLLGIALALASARQANAEAIHSAPAGCTTGSPPSNEAWVYDVSNFQGHCYRLPLGSVDLWTAWDATAGFPNDAIRSIRTGSGVNLVLFWNGFYTQDNGATFSVGPNTSVSDMGSWNGKASAARVQSFPANSCFGVGDAPIRLFTDQSYGGDCTVLAVGPRCYKDPFEMGFRNDTLSSMTNVSNVYTPNLYKDSNFHNLWWTLPKGFFGDLSTGDLISSIAGDSNSSCP